MDAGTRRQLELVGAGTGRALEFAAVPELGRRAVVVLAERARERLMRLVAGRKRQFRDGGVVVQQTPSSALEPQTPVELEWGLPQRPAEHAMKMKRRKRRPPCQRWQIQRPVQTRHQLVHGPL